MSYSTVYIVQGKNFIGIEELRNSHGFGPFVWSAICARYMGKGSYWLSSNDIWQRMNALPLSPSWRATLLASYDYAIIEKARFADVAKLIREFVADVGVRGMACHWPTIADLLDANAISIGAERATGMCFYGTSLSDDFWHPWDSEKDKGGTYNIKTGKKHFFVGAALDEYAEKAKP